MRVIVHLIAAPEKRLMRQTRCGMPTNRATLTVVDRIDQGVTCRMCRWCARKDAGGEYGGP